MTKHQLLKQYFGYDSFRPLQEEIIDHIYQQKDCLVLMPTGGGKSICYQLPALMFEGLTVVISPLIALMKDQVEALRSNGIQASYLNSSLSAKEQDAVLWAAKMGELKLLYIAPEKLFTNHTLDFFKSLTISLFAIDESHCISSWGHDFRPEYRQLAILKKDFPKTPTIALTATADKITRKDICKQLGIDEANIYISSFDRPNISLSVLPGRKRIEQIHDFLIQHPSQAGIIYCLSRKSTETVSDSLKKMGFDAACYHAGLSADQRNNVQERFINDDIQVIVATVAFGMGIDKSNVRWVIHYNLPSNVENFYQEIGRAGRDGEKAEAVLFYSLSDVFTRRDMIKNNEMPEEQKTLLEAKLERLQQYAEANICRRRILISYFNEDLGKDCGNCDVCKNPRKHFDATTLSQKALSAVARTRETIGLTMLVDILRGSRNQTIIKNGYEQLPTFGVGKDLKPEVWMDYIIQMVNYGAMEIAYDDDHNFKLNDVSWQILKGNRTVELSAYISPAERKAKDEEDNFTITRPTRNDWVQNELFGRLRVFRKQLADKLRLPPYLIVNDASLLEMSNRMPTTKSEMLSVSGIGQEKFNRYGEALINEIKQYLDAHPEAKQQALDKAIQHRSARKLERREKRGEPKVSTYQQTLELFRDGFSIEEIAEKRLLSPSTIAAHLIKLKEDGERIDLKKLINPADYDKIMTAVKALNLKKEDGIKPLFEFFDERIGYDILRIALAI